MVSPKTPLTKRQHDTEQGAGSAPESHRPWEDRSLSAEARYKSYYDVVRAKCEAIRDAGMRPGVTTAERYRISQDPEANFWVEELRQLKSESPEDFCRRTDRRDVAQEMVDSYTFDKTTGLSTFTVPAGVTDVEAMKALNLRFRETQPWCKRDAVCAQYLDWFQNLPEAFPEHCQERDYSHARQILIWAVAKGTWERDRSAQEAVLKEKGLVFSDPRDQAIAAALHACKRLGSDLFSNLWVRGSIPGKTLATFRGIGVCPCKSSNDNGDDTYAASGSPSPESN